MNFGKKNKERIRLLRLIPLLYGDNHIFSLTEAILLSNILYVNSPIFFHLIYYQHFCIIIHYKYAILNLFTFYKISEFSTLFYILVYFNAHKYTCSFHIDVFLFILYFLFYIDFFYIMYYCINQLIQQCDLRTAERSVSYGVGT